MLEAGQIVEVEVYKVAVFGLFCRHGEQELLLLIPETSWVASYCSCEQFAAPGDRFNVKILHVDLPSGKVSASISAMHPDPWQTGLMAPGTVHQARVVRFVPCADRCGNGPGYLLELLPGAYVMLCGDEPPLEIGQTSCVTVLESDFSKRAVRVARP